LHLIFSDSLMKSPISALLYLSKMFVVEVDSFGYAIAAMLMQNHHPIAFISRALYMQQ